MCPIKRTLLLLVSTFLVLSNTIIQSQEATGPQNRKPLITLEEGTRAVGADSSLWRLNSLNPSFVLYDDGLAVFKKGIKSLEYYSVKLDDLELKALLKKFEINEFLKLGDSYSTNNKFHQPVNFIKYRRGSKMKKVRVIGTLRDDQKDRSQSPKAFLTVFDQMVSFKNKNSQLWTPYQLEIALYPQKNPQGEPVPWPSEWPDLNHKTTKKRSASDLSHSYMIYLDGSHKRELERMISGLKENQAVIINDNPWYLAPKKYIFPNEKMWDTEKSKGEWDTIRKVEKRTGSK